MTLSQAEFEEIKASQEEFIAAMDALRAARDRSAAALARLNAACRVIDDMVAAYEAVGA